MFEPNVLDCAYTAVHPLGIKNSSKIVFCFGSVLISQHKQAALSSFKMGEAVYYWNLNEGLHAGILIQFMFI